jgi:hypothetical protein
MSFRPERSRYKVLAAVVAVAAVAGLAFFLLGPSGTRLGGPIAKAATVSSRTAGYRMRMAIQLTSSALSSPITATGGGVLTSALSTSGRSWMKVDVAKLSSLPGLSSLASNPTTSDPSQILRSLRSVSDSIVNEGRQRVDGVWTTHYQAAMSMTRLADGLPSAQRSVLAHAVPGATFPADVWIDKHNLVRRVLMSLDLGLSNGPSVQETVTMDLGHYGRQRPPATPPADQVQDLSSLAGAAG